MIARQVSFFAPAAIMSAWGVVMLHIIVTGHINRLLNPLFHSYVLIAAILLLLLSAAYVLLYQPSDNPAPPLAPTGRLRQLLRWALLLLPVLAASVLSPSALSSTTMNNRALLNSTAGVTAMPSMSAATDQNVKDALAADPNQPVPVDVTDLITLAKSPDQIKSFAGRKVHAIGFIITPPGGSPKLVRWLMWCCAADAQPVSVALTGNLAGPYKDSDWYEIVGTAEFPSTLGQVTPQIDVDTVKPTQEPDEPYLSP
jgi:uncharacterized repeat protein (TIGR03943 family)